MKRELLSGNEAIAHAAMAAGVALGTGYPGTPSTEILENFSAYGGRAQWAPNEKTALEVGIGSAFAGARTLVTMKHVGVNVAADPLFTVAYTGVTGALVIVSADDPGMASSQNEQDNRRYAVAAGVPMLEPSDSQEAYDFLLAAIEISEKWHIPVLYRLTTRVCHSMTIVDMHEAGIAPANAPHFVRDVKGRVMIPAFARPAHKNLRAKLHELQEWSEKTPFNLIVEGSKDLGIIASAISYMHVREAAPEASVLKIGMSYPLPMEKIKQFAAGVKRCVVIEEGDPYLYESIRAAGIEVEGRPEIFRFGELNVARVKRILTGDTTPEAAPPAGKPPQLCVGCPHRTVFETLRDLDCIVAGDIGCYTLGVLPPFNALDTCVCMGASITAGLGMRHVLPENEARRVVSVIGDSTFVHSGLTGIAEMVYNTPPTGHLVVILDNGTTAMTGLQEHPGTGRKLNHEPTSRLVIEDVIAAMGVKDVHVLDATKSPEGFKSLVETCLKSNAPAVIIARKPCLLAAKRIREFEKPECV